MVEPSPCWRRLTTDLKGAPPEAGGGGLPTETAAHVITTTDTPENISDGAHFTSGDGGGEGEEAPEAEVLFLYRLKELGVPFWVAERGRDKEFHRPTGWQQITGEGNLERLDRWREGDALSANTGEIVAVVDVDPRNGRSV